MELHSKLWNAVGDLALWAYHEARVYRGKRTFLRDTEEARDAVQRVAAADYRHVERVTDISMAEFARRYLMQTTPVIVADGSRGWPARQAWTFEHFASAYGDMQVQLQGSGFEMKEQARFGTYLEQITALPDIALGEKGRDLSYLRYTYGPKLQHLLFTWGFGHRVKSSHFTCVAYQRIQDDWHLPYFLQEGEYRMPWVQLGKLRPNKRMCLDWGLYFSAPGACTRLHVDGTRTNAIICQMQGTKSGWLFSPDLEYPSKRLAEDITTRTVAPVVDQGGRATQGTIWRFDLKPGEIMLIPKGLTHEVHTLSPSISMIYNFITNAEYPDYYRQMQERGPGWVASAPVADNPHFRAIYERDQGEVPSKRAARG